MPQVSDEQQIGDVRAMIERLLNDAQKNNEPVPPAIRVGLVALAEAIQRVEKTISRKIALGIEKSKVGDLW